MQSETSYIKVGIHIKGFTFQKKGSACCSSLSKRKIIGNAVLDTRSLYCWTWLLSDPFWIQVQKFPLENLSTTSAATLLTKVGEVVYVEDPLVKGKLVHDFLKGRVWVDVTNPFQLDAGSLEWIFQNCRSVTAMKGYRTCALTLVSLGMIRRLWVSYLYERL